MKKIITFLSIIIALSICSRLNAQTVVDSSAATVVPDKVPEFKNGLKGWARFLESNLDTRLMMGVPAGKYTAIASFLVDSIGRVRDIYIEYDPGYGVGKEMERILKRSSKSWVPAMANGLPVSYRHRQSLTLASNGL